MPEFMDMWVQDKNPNPDSLPWTTKIKCHWKCRTCGSELFQEPFRFLYKKDSTRCKKCCDWSSLQDSLAWNYLHLLNEYHPDNELPPSRCYPRSGRKALWVCPKGHEYRAKVCERTRDKGATGCPFCDMKKVTREDSFGGKYPELLKEWHSENTESPFSIAPSANRKFKWKCSKCDHVWKCTAHSRISVGTGCPKCCTSHGEKKIAEILKSLGRPFETEKTFKNCSHKNLLRYDFYLPEENVLIEFHGKQHYQAVKWNKKMSEEKAQERFRTCRIRDQIKRSFAEKSSILLYEIPHWHEKNLESIVKNILA